MSRPIMDSASNTRTTRMITNAVETSRLTNENNVEDGEIKGR